ncbi:Uma2 family endonuclease [Rudanella lutea]|uniref:Uma2 family endonuclease n=1 Tax=Rudanella lutea TaxID=451374 RepID=UPI00036E26EA|nr:Uma2 family endonuclease [Rudanella lutea]
MIATRKGIQSRQPRQNVPDYLVYELMDGKPIYYRGYQAVISGKKTFSEIMGSSTLQSFIVAYCQRILFKQLDEDLFTILSSETGIHLDKHNNLAGDILVFDNATLPITAINTNYADVPPKLVIEVDVTADPTHLDENAYIFKKTQKLLSFGVEKVIWITTEAKKVTIATANEDWQIKDWHKDIDVMPGVVFTIGQYLTEKGSPYA